MRFGRSIIATSAHADGPLVWQAATRVMNPCVTQAYIDGEYEKDPVSAAAEFGAQFRTDIEIFVSREAIEAATDWGVHEREPLSGNRYVAFVDPSGGSADSFTLGRRPLGKPRSPCSIACARSGRRSPRGCGRGILRPAEALQRHEGQGRPLRRRMAA